MNALQKYFARAASELGLRIEVDYPVTLSDGRVLRSEVLLPDLGNHSGTLVFTTEGQPDRSARKELLELRYATSVMSGVVPTHAAFDIESLKETFADWGWAGDPTLTPTWLKDKPQISYH